MRPYYLHKRVGIWYAELVDMETGCKLTACSTGKTNRDEALLVIAEWLKNGVPTGRKGKTRPVELAADIENILNHSGIIIRLNYKGRFAEFLSHEYINKILKAGITAIFYWELYLNGNLNVNINYSCFCKLFGSC